MKRVLLIAAVLLGGCEGLPATTEAASPLTAGELIGTWQAGRATLALAPTGDYAYVAPNGAIVGPARWEVQGRTLRLAGFPEARVVFSGDSMAVTMPSQPENSVWMLRRVATYCTPTGARQSCQ